VGLNIARFCSLLFAALALAPALAHLMELPNKLGLSRADYLTVQQIYRGWAWLGIVVVGALLSTLALTLMLRNRSRAFGLALLAFLCIAGAQVVFWTFTFPVNRQTLNWTVMPENWAALRAQWEYSHAAAAALNLVAFVALIVSGLVTERSRAIAMKSR
jgi:hypothetical protein